jgi:hypothetical protein
MEDIHLGPVPGRPSTPYFQLLTPRTEEKTEEHIELEDCEATLNTEPMEGLTNGEGGEGTVALNFQEITSSRTIQHNPTVPRYIPDQSPHPQNKGKGVPCQRCFQVGHQRDNCDTPIWTFSHYNQYLKRKWTPENPEYLQ